MMHTSVVVPIKNEEDNIVDLISEIEPVMNLDSSEARYTWP